MRPSRIDSENTIIGFLPKEEDKTVQILKELLNSPLTYEERMLVSARLTGNISQEEFDRAWVKL